MNRHLFYPNRVCLNLALSLLLGGAVLCQNALAQGFLTGLDRTLAAPTA